MNAKTLKTIQARTSMVSLLVGLRPTADQRRFQSG
jgi:hypothetical protein